MVDSHTDLEKAYVLEMRSRLYCNVKAPEHSCRGLASLGAPEHSGVREPAHPCKGAHSKRKVDKIGNELVRWRFGAGGECAARQCENRDGNDDGLVQ